MSNHLYKQQQFVKHLQLSDCMLDARDTGNVIHSLYSRSLSDGRAMRYQFQHEKNLQKAVSKCYTVSWILKNQNIIFPTEKNRE